MTTTDRIEKQIHLAASPERVWRAISDAREFGQWFRADLRDDFLPGATVRGRITYEGYEHLMLEMQIETMERERLFSFRWHPYAVDTDVDYTQEPTTLVEFRLERAPGGTKLTVIESGFDRIPADRRPRAFEMNSAGWTEQLENIARHV